MFNFPSQAVNDLILPRLACLCPFGEAHSLDQVSHKKGRLAGINLVFFLVKSKFSLVGKRRGNPGPIPDSFGGTTPLTSKTPFQST